MQLAISHPDALKAAMAPITFLLVDLLDARVAVKAIDGRRHAAHGRAHASRP
jgi:hypothetical protein